MTTKRYLLYGSQLYALEILRPLQRVIRQRNEEVAWFFDGPGADHLKPGERLLQTVDEVKRFNPDAVFVPGNVVPDFFPGIKVQVFHGLATDETGKKGHYRVRGFFDLYCTRGEEETAKFRQLAKIHGSFRVAQTGWPKLDPLFSPGKVPDVRKDLDMPVDRPVILYGSTFSPSLTSAPHLYETIKGLSKSREWSWLVTLHPKMDAKVVERYRNLSGGNLQFYESHEDVLPLLHAADVMLCDTSSLAIEFQLLLKPLVTFRARCSGPQQLDISETGEVESALKLAIERPPELMAATKVFAEKLHPFRDGKSSHRVLEAVDAFCSEGRTGLARKPLNLVRKGKIRLKLGYYKLR